MNKLHKGSTVISVWPHLTHQRQYVAGIRQKMMTCEKAHGNARVIIGITGTGQKPCYRIVYNGASQNDLIYGSYWDNHDPLSKEDAQNGNWADTSLTTSEVDQFLKKQIGWRGA